MTWMLPSTIALLIKLFLFFYSNVYKKKHFLIFLILMSFLNLTEFLLFFRFYHLLLFLKMYYIFAVFSVFYLAFLCSEISESFAFLKSDVLFLLACFLSGAILLSDTIVAGFHALPNGSITRIAGDYYFVFQAYVLSFLVCSLLVLVKGAMTKKDYHVRSRCIVALLAFCPAIIVIFILVALMQLGYQVNMVGFLSLALCFMLFVFISLSEKHKLFTMMTFVPFSKERSYHLQLKRLLGKLSQPIAGEKVDMKALLKEIEVLVIKNTQHYFATQKEVARVLTLSESTLSRKLESK